MATKKKDLGPSILRRLEKGPASLPTIVKYLGANDAWDRVQRALQRLRKEGKVEFDAKKWRKKLSAR